MKHKYSAAEIKAIRKEAFDQGYAKGHFDGYSTGWKNGLDKGFKQGLDEGRYPDDDNEIKTFNG